MPIGHKSGLYAGTINGFHFEARLDIDGDQPQDQISVTLTNRLPSHWIAELRRLSSRTWEGAVWYRHRRADRVRVSGARPNRLRVTWRTLQGREFIELEFRRNSRRLATIELDHQSTAMRHVEFELDREAGVQADTGYNTHAHPVRPGNLPAEDLTLTSVYERSGVAVTVNDQNNTFAAGAGANQRWNITELHDAMQANWSRADGTPWAMWVVFASLFENDPGTVVFGIMFDVLGNFHRNGTAVMMQEIEDFYPQGIPNRQATIDRHKFRTLIHEVGHAFNLLHSWEKELGTPWHPSVLNEPEAGSFMNYPGRVSGGEDEYWRRFRFRFSDQELMFMRHAPEEFVAMGGASWAENHADRVAPDMTEAFQGDGGDAGLQLSLRFNRPANVFAFMEPVLLEVKLKNVSARPASISSLLVHDLANMQIFITRNFGETQTLRPYAKLCYAPAGTRVLQPGEADYGSVYLSSATNGWLIAEPGRYDVVVNLQGKTAQGGRSREFAANATTTLFVQQANPAERLDMQRFAQDYFSEDIGRMLAFGGSEQLHSGRQTLDELVQRYRVSAAAQHASIALQLPATRNYKLLNFEDGKPSVRVQKYKPEVLQDLSDNLRQHGRLLATSLGHITFKNLTDTLCDRLADADQQKAAADMQRNTLEVMAQRQAKLPAPVLQGIQARIAAYDATD